MAKHTDETQFGYKIKKKYVFRTVIRILTSFWEMTENTKGHMHVP